MSNSRVEDAMTVSPFTFCIGNDNDYKEINANSRREAIVEFLSGKDIQRVDIDDDVEKLVNSYGISIEEYEKVEAGVPVRFYDFQDPVLLGSVDVLVSDGNYEIFEEEKPDSWRVIFYYHHPEEPSGSMFEGLHLDGDAAHAAWNAIYSECISARHPSRQAAIEAAKRYVEVVRAMTNLSAGSEPRGLVFRLLFRGQA